MPRYTATERIGVNKVEQIIINEYKWIFREQPLVDMGIDAHIESVNGMSEPTGKLIGLQIKTGASHFHKKANTYTFYLNKTHYEYWINHSLPVILIGHLPEENLTIWEFVNENNVIKTKTQWKIEIPKGNILNNHSSQMIISDYLNNKTLNAKINKLIFDRGLIQYLNNGGRINIYTEEWHNKSLGRGPFKILLIDKDGKEKKSREWSSFYVEKLEDYLEKIFPWATISNDIEYYEDNFCESVYMIYNPEFIHTLEIHPYKISYGEVGHYRINLELNNIGKSFLGLEAYLEL